MFSTYVLHSPSTDRIYIGYTSDLANRLRFHNELATKGWTIKFRPWVLIYSEVFSDKAQALKREKELKTSRGRVFIRSLINQNN